MQTLSELLAQLTKDELHEIRKGLKVKYASHLNKQDLMERLTDEIMHRTPFLLLRFDRKRFALVQMALRRGGVLADDLIGENFEFYPSYFQRIGLFFWDGHALRMPKELMDEIEQFDQHYLKSIIDRNTEWTRLAQGMLYYYGVMSTSDLIKKMTSYVNADVDEMELLNVLDEYCMYDEGICYAPPHGFAHFMVDDPGEIVKQHEMRRHIDYYPFTKEQLLQASSDDYVDRHEHYRRLIFFLESNWHLDASIAETMMEELVIAIQMDQSPSELVGMLQSQLEFSDMRLVCKLVDLVMHFYNRTRQWALKGYDPYELSLLSDHRHELAPDRSFDLEVHVSSVNPTVKMTADVYDFQTKKKIDRDDPCPCGSGKMYKHCCG